MLLSLEEPIPMIAQTSPFLVEKISSMKPFFVDVRFIKSPSKQVLILARNNRVRSHSSYAVDVLETGCHRSNAQHIWNGSRPASQRQSVLPIGLANRRVGRLSNQGELRNQRRGFHTVCGWHPSSG